MASTPSRRSRRPSSQRLPQAKSSIPLPTTSFLIGLCRESGLELPEDLDAADRLAPYATTVRYGLGKPSLVEPSEAIHWAQSAIAWAEEKLAS